MGNFLTYDDFYKPLVKSYQPQLSRGTAEEIATAHLSGILKKGLNTTGTITSGGSNKGGDALKQQDLMRQIAVAELQAASHATLWNWVKKTPTFTDVVEQTTLDAWGGRRRGGFINAQSADGGLAGSDPTLNRRALPIKWLGGRYQVFRAALAIQALRIQGDPIVGGAEDVASTAKAQQLILNANEMCWFGNPDENEMEPNGIIKQIRDANSSRFVTRFNLNGQPLTPEVFADIEQILRSQGGIWTDMFWSPTAFSDTRKSMLAFTRTNAGYSGPTGSYADQELIMNLAGNRDVAKLHIDNFLDAPPADSQASGPKPPTKPSAAVVATDSSNAENAWGSHLPAGTYNYKVRAVGVNGWSEMKDGSTSVAPNGTSQSVKITITNDSSNNTGDVAFFEIFRGDGATGEVQYLGRVKANTVAGNATVEFYDNGEFVPGASTAVALTNRQFGLGGQEVMVRQLYPMTKVKLPNDVMAEQSAWLLGMTPQVVVPNLCLVLENIGRLS